MVSSCKAMGVYELYLIVFRTFSLGSSWVSLLKEGLCPVGMILETYSTGEFQNFSLRYLLKKYEGREGERD